METALISQVPGSSGYVTSILKAAIEGCKIAQSKNCPFTYQVSAFYTMCSVYMNRVNRLKQFQLYLFISSTHGKKSIMPKQLLQIIKFKLSSTSYSYAVFDF